ncbi:MAG: T9SS type A sorting domain-containing protein, partial [Ignavibacteriae bacterium]|nr:T9SS type A sorting domain-containing protein [Ignavibacteriota bacterium]
GLYSVNYLPAGGYDVKVSSIGHSPDSMTVTLNDTLRNATADVILQTDSAYAGPTNVSIQVNGGALFTGNPQLVLTLTAQGATEMRIDENPDFASSSWGPFVSTANYSLADTTEGLKIVYAKFRTSGATESGIVNGRITYSHSTTAQLSITSSTPGATVILDSRPTTFLTPSLIPGIPFGQYSVAVMKSGFSSSPSLVLVSLDTAGTHGFNFTVTNVPPQSAKSFEHFFSGDTLYLTCEAPSDQDLALIRINYRLDGVFPQDPNDGTNLLHQISLPNQYLNATLVGMPMNTPHYFAVFAIDSGGLYSAPRTLIAIRTSTGVAEGSSIPTEFALFQNYPNPFNPSTTIEFWLPKESNTTLEIYNLLGQKIATLVNEVRAPGTYKERFDASGLASGVYLYRLRAGEFVQTRKLLLLR